MFHNYYIDKSSCNKQLQQHQPKFIYSSNSNGKPTIVENYIYSHNKQNLNLQRIWQLNNLKTKQILVI